MNKKIKKIGIIGAMEQEVARLKDILEDVEVSHIAAMDFYEGKMHGTPVVIVRSGVGKVNAAICTQILIDRYQADAIINTGIAGSLDASIDIGDIVVSTDLIQHDVDARVFGYAPGEIPQLKKLSFAADEHMRRLAAEICRQEIPGIHVHEGRSASGDIFVSSKEKKEEIAATFAASAAEMEGAAIAQTAWLNRIPFVVLRAISDKADGSAFMDYDAFESLAIEHSLILTEKFVERFTQSEG